MNFTANTERVNIVDTDAYSESCYFFFLLAIEKLMDAETHLKCFDMIDALQVIT